MRVSNLWFMLPRCGGNQCAGGMERAMVGAPVDPETVTIACVVPPAELAANRNGLGWSVADGCGQMRALVCVH